MEPLASRMRPRTLDEYVGQTHLVGAGAPLARIFAERTHLSFILWGPPGTGKTSLARLYGDALGLPFFELSAVSAGKRDVMKVIGTGTAHQPALLFLDEIHRFNKAQQDVLLPHVESGSLILVGATTENPSFEVISPLLSRCQVFVLYPLSDEDLERLLSQSGVALASKARSWLISYANGDARRMLAGLETATALYDEITPETLARAVQNANVRYDKKGDEHFDTISAYIKSMRAGQVDAALHYLARMIEGGEDPKFIARRMIIFVSEDVGQAAPTALVVANEVFRAVEVVGLPEAGINLAHGTVYLSTARKDRSAYEAYMRARDDVKEYGNLPIPLSVRNAPTRLMKDLGYGKGYRMYPERDDTEATYLPEALKNIRYYTPEKGDFS